MAYKQRQGIVCPADSNLDATGDSALLGAIQKGHPGIVKALLEYGGDPNKCCNVPGFKEMKVSYFILAIFCFDMQSNAEQIIDVLIDGVGNSKRGDVNAVSMKGTALTAAASIVSNHAARMRICRKLLANGADPNQVLRDPLGNQGHLLNHLCGVKFGNYTAADRIELFRLLVDAGADPGFMCKLNRETVNPIHIEVNRRMSDLLACFLSCEKGRAAVNSKRREVAQVPREHTGDGETPITMCVACNNLEFCRPCREMAVELFKAGDAKILSRKYCRRPKVKFNFGVKVYYAVILTNSMAS